MTLGSNIKKKRCDEHRMSEAALSRIGQKNPVFLNEFTIIKSNFFPIRKYFPRNSAENSHACLVVIIQITVNGTICHTKIDTQWVSYIQFLSKIFS